LTFSLFAVFVVIAAVVLLAGYLLAARLTCKQRVVLTKTGLTPAGSKQVYPYSEVEHLRVDEPSIEIIGFLEKPWSGPFIQSHTLPSLFLFLGSA
jgi:hypothetical protein